MTGELGGVYLAIVDSNKLDERGRIGITIPHSERAGSYPAHIASFMAGDQRGALFLPEKDDQVLVAFVNGMADAPVIIGSLWSSVDKPPEANADGDNDVKVIKTRAGNQIRITDKSGEEKIEIAGKDGNTRVVLDIAKKSIEITTDETNGNIMVKGKKITWMVKSISPRSSWWVPPAKTTIDGNQITGS